MELLELYEYKVADVLAGNEPKGGRASLLRLRHQLINQLGSSPLLKRFREADMRYKRFNSSNNIVAVQSSPPKIDPIPQVAIPAIQETPKAVLPEHQVLAQLSEAVYWIQLEREMARVVKSLLSRKREELRLAYAFLQNLDAYRRLPQFTQDYNLSRFTPTYAIPALSDPLVHLDEKVAQGLLMELFREISVLPLQLKLPPDELLSYVRRFLRRLVDSLDTLRNTGQRGPSVDSLRRALEEARNRRLFSEAQDIEQRLQNAVAEERRLSLVFEEDKLRFAGATERLVSLLARHLLAPLGEAAPTPITPKVLGMTHPEMSLSQVPEGATSLTLRLMPIRLKLGGLDVAISGSAGQFAMFFDGAEYPLTADKPLILPSSGLELWALRYGDYLHLRVETREGSQLSGLLNEGRLVAYLISPGTDYAYMRLLRAFSSRIKGPTDYSGFGSASATRYQEAPVESLEEFARKGLEVVQSRLSDQADWRPWLAEAARALGLPQQGQHLESMIANWLTDKPPTQETLGGDMGSLSLSENPASLVFGSSVLSLRYQEGNAYASMIGMAPRKLNDLLVWRLLDGAAVIVREGNRVTHVFVPYS